MRNIQVTVHAGRKYMINKGKRNHKRKKGRGGKTREGSSV
jgi:hypothetical protein